MLRVLMIVAMVLAADGCVTRPRADFVVTDKAISAPLVGFGACANPYLYAYPNSPSEISPSAMRDLEAKVKSLHPQFIRMFFLQSWWDSDTDPVIAKNHPGMRESFIKTVRLAQESGAKVLIQFWYDPGRYKDVDAVMGRFAQSIAEMRRKYSLTAIEYATIQNEPNDDGKDITPEQYVRVYRAFDRELKASGIRGDVKVIPGDLLYEHQLHWFELLGRELSPIADGYSIHVYWDYWDIDRFVRHVEQVKAILAKMPASQRRPIYVTEFGAQGFRDRPDIEPGKSEDGKPLADAPVYSFEMGLFLIEAMNAGYLATAQWDLYDAWYDRKMGYGLIGPVQEGFREKPGYWLLWMFTHSIEPGWRSVKIDGEVEDLWIAGARGAHNSVTVVVGNRAPGVREISVSGLPAGKLLHARFWNWEGKGLLTKQQTVRVDDRGMVRIAAAEMSIAVLTTNPGRE
jgi:hypothetical protein